MFPINMVIFGIVTPFVDKPMCACVCVFNALLVSDWSTAATWIQHDVIFRQDELFQLFRLG